MLWFKKNNIHILQLELKIFWGYAYDCINHRMNEIASSHLLNSVRVIAEIWNIGPTSCVIPFFLIGVGWCAGELSVLVKKLECYSFFYMKLQIMILWPFIMLLSFFPNCDDDLACLPFVRTLESLENLTSYISNLVYLLRNSLCVFQVITFES